MGIFKYARTFKAFLQTSDALSKMVIQSVDGSNWQEKELLDYARYCQGRVKDSSRTCPDLAELMEISANLTADIVKKVDGSTAAERNLISEAKALIQAFSD